MAPFSKGLTESGERSGTLSERTMKVTQPASGVL